MFEIYYKKRGWQRHLPIKGHACLLLTVTASLTAGSKKKINEFWKFVAVAGLEPAPSV